MSFRRERRNNPVSSLRAQPITRPAVNLHPESRRGCHDKREFGHIAGKDGARRRKQASRSKFNVLSRQLIQILFVVDVNARRWLLLVVSADLPRYVNSIVLSPAGYQPFRMCRIAGKR